VHLETTANLEISPTKLNAVTVAGTRPELIKLAEFVRIFNDHQNALLYTGQHFSSNMRDVFLDQLGIKPDLDLNAATSSVTKLTELLIKKLEPFQPSNVIIYGDTNSSMAAALAAKELGSRLIHIEAGVRDFDLAVPEESTRIKIDAMADLLLAPSDFCQMCLGYENVRGRVLVTGNLIVDVCRKLADVASNVPGIDLPELFVLLTMHRPENVDDPTNLGLLVKHLSRIGDTVVFPIHPRTRANLDKYKITLPPNVMAIDPLGYHQFLYLLKRCNVVLTDSGGIQEESIVLRKPCITLRHTSARWETILLGANRLFPLARTDSINEVIKEMFTAKISINPYGENVAQKTCDAIKEFMSS
jgi:UDP-GlcNAc3NAcA epimerase